MRKPNLSTTGMVFERRNHIGISSDTCTGFPIATLPISYLDFNGRPIGLMIAAPHHKESTLIKVMSAWEATFPARQEPREFLKHSSVAQQLQAHYLAGYHVSY